MNAKPTSVPSPNPNGMASLSPGLTQSDYPGWALMKDTTPTGLRQTRRARGCNPFRVGAVGFMVSQGKLEQIITRTLRVGSCRATLGCMAELFQTTVPNVSMHLRNVYAEGELQPVATFKEFLIVRQEGNRRVSRAVEHYNLDAIISVGYRVKSAVATAVELDTKAA